MPFLLPDALSGCTHAAELFDIITAGFQVTGGYTQSTTKTTTSSVTVTANPVAAERPQRCDRTICYKQKDHFRSSEVGTP